MSIAIEKLDHLPENLIVEILSRLPVKDLLQFKSVCKSWCSIISSPAFASKHLKNYYYSNNDTGRSCLLVQFPIPYAEHEVYELLVDETPRVLADEVLAYMPKSNSYVCGPCDGIYYMFHCCRRERALWNPAINEFRPLPTIISRPDLPANLTYENYEVYGFGLDPITRDYKVVVVKGYWNTLNEEDSYLNDPISVLVYSLRTNLWKYCGDLRRPYNLEVNTCYIYVNGCCYWFGSYDSRDEVIISFDLAIDTFKEMDVPDYAQPSSKCLGMYDDSLAFMSLHESEKNFDVWTLKEGRWTKKLSVGPFPDVWRPLGHSMDNKLLLQCHDGGLGLLDPDTQEIKDLAFQHTWCAGAFAYMESLVSIKDKNAEEVEAGNI
uniref:F-box domain-containing protein n=2 Tax=Chenopodium quinoa TaxID=63459 RepID=A0A803KZU7_CHEQI